MAEADFDFTWKFQRLGGLDQVTLRSAEELTHLGQLDPKLWVALSCPASGLEFDQRTLTLMDSDHDGRIRIPEVVAAVEWACARLADPAALVEPLEAMPLSAVKADTDDGAHLLASARAVLKSLGRPDQQVLTQEDVMEAAAQASRNLLNGDGIMPAHESLEPDLRQFINEALAVVGGLRDASGRPGIDETLLEAFLKSLRDWQDWKAAVGEAVSPLGDDTPEAGELVQKLKAKIDDYFLRCDLASFAPQSVPSLNSDESLAQTLEHGSLDMEYLSGLPLAHVEAGRPLGLAGGLNPAFKKEMTRLFQLTGPLRDQPDFLSREDWQRIQDSLAAYADILAGKPALPAREVEYAPTGSLEELGAGRIGEILNSDVPSRLKDLLIKDGSAPGASTEVAALERLVLYYKHLYRFLMNFVSFYDFYAGRQAAFQTGLLFLDGRGCHLCLPVDDVDRHSTLAGRSLLCLAYCRCRRRSRSGPEGPDENLNIVAAVTAGDSDLLLEGRNGVFVDLNGRDWDATIVKLVPNPIDLKQAVWEPYKKAARFISEQIDKFAGSKNEKLWATATQKISGAALPTAPAAAPAKAAGTSFDIGKSVGIFAAIGLALGALGTAAASLARAFFSLNWYEMPLVFLGLFLIISGPSVILAWLKLRKRTIGPLLEASGWAVNSRVPINLSLGRQLTDAAALPDNATRSFNDPLKPPRKWPWRLLLLMALLLGALLTWVWLQPTVLL